MMTARHAEPSGFFWFVFFDDKKNEQELIITLLLESMNTANMLMLYRCTELCEDLVECMLWRNYNQNKLDFTISSKPFLAFQLRLTLAFVASAINSAGSPSLFWTNCFGIFLPNCFSNSLIILITE